MWNFIKWSFLALVNWTVCKKSNGGKKRKMSSGSENPPAWSEENSRLFYFEFLSYTLIKFYLTTLININIFSSLLSMPKSNVGQWKKMLIIIAPGRARIACNLKYLIFISFSSILQIIVTNECMNDMPKIVHTPPWMPRFVIIKVLYLVYNFWPFLDGLQTFLE